MISKTTGIAAGAAVAGVAAITVMGARALKGAAADVGPVSTPDAARFLTQCAFGVTDADIASVSSLGFSGWLDQQMAMTSFNTFTWTTQRVSQRKSPAVNGGDAFVESFWTGVATRSDQLRQRMQFALSQILVVSRENSTLEYEAPTATGHFYDILAQRAFGNFRDLLNDITYNPIMGVFLSFVSNELEDPLSGRHPDENYAREIMQLFTIGTVQLNPDGTPQRGANGATIPTYSHDDIAGLAKVFTGLSWYSPSPNDGTFQSSAYGFTDTKGAPSVLIAYPKFHSISAKTFLGVTIPASATANVAGDVKIALDTLFNHPNVGPFLAIRLIQQFVTSNPSPGYVGRVAAVFNNNGQGVRGDLGAVLRAILLDVEARSTDPQANPAFGLNFGKLREPMIRITNWARAFAATSKNGFFNIGETGDPNVLSQGILDAPSVFNFWRPGYQPPHTRMGNQGLVAPEFQVVSELTVASYINLIQDTVASGIGTNLKTFSGSDVSAQYSDEVALASTPPALLDRLNLLLFYGQMPDALRQQILTAVNAIATTAAPGKKALTPAQVQTALLNRVKLAIVLCMVSGDYLVQR